MWKYGTKFRKEDVEQAMQYVEKLFVKYGAIPTDLNSENRSRLGQRITYLFNNEYYRVDVIYFDYKPHIVFEWIDNIKSATVGVMEDGDSFPFDLSNELIEKEVRYLFGIEPYPADYPNYDD